ncbi:hypothetical protein [Acinetobacter pittii]|uniref:hypothetical protein n=1 Tax=Acinetobacter pittii TaxID=48296 RepID=UPI000839A2DA|nr:hypothetical protein [Acinetobacter pittii]OCY53740.1 hypothetical protein BFR81_04235 [Acinetobacter pittii]
MQKEQITGQEINFKLSVDDGLMKTGFSLTFKPDYNLSEAEFKDLNSPPRTWDWLTSGLFLFGIGLLLTCLSRYLAYSLLSASKVEAYEWICGFIAVGLAGITWLIGYFISNPKKIVMKKIEKHFSTSTPLKHFVSKRDL